jgi:phosphoribosylanthranilate isomerase
VFLKICGITRLVDAQIAIDAGATALGFVLWPRSPRFVSDRQVAEIVAALPASVVTVGVFVNQPPEGIAMTMERTGLGAIQLHGDEHAEYLTTLQRPSWRVWKSVTLDRADALFGAWPAETTFLVDAADPIRRGGTGQAVDWARAADLARRRNVVLAGGLTPENVADAIERVRPYGVDVSSGVEDAPGLKNASKVIRFLHSARRAVTDLESHKQMKGMN